jgi:hypothetical protein
MPTTGILGQGVLGFLVLGAGAGGSGGGSFENLSFELADGTPAALTSLASEPYNLSDGDFFIIAVNNTGPQTVVFQTADFVAIGAATAAEVAAVITASLNGASALDTGGQVLIYSDLYGADACLEVLGGPALVGVPFTMGQEVCGTTYPGKAKSWLISALGTNWGVGEFDTSLAVSEGYEDYEEGWDSNESWLLGFEAEDLQIGMFSDGALKDSYDIAGYQFELGALAAAAFSDGDSVETYEDSWNSNEDDVTAFAAGQLDSATTEDYESSWNSNESWVTSFGGGSLEPGVFGQGGNVETYEENTDAFMEVLITSAAVGAIYDVQIDGVSHVYVSAGTDPVTVAVQLSDAVNNSSVPWTAAALGSGALILTQDNPGSDGQVRLVASTPSSMIDVTNNLVDSSTMWTGSSFLQN